MNKRIAFYTRISKADMKNNSVSNSIEHQINILYDAVNQTNCLYNSIDDNFKPVIYIDDGYSGKNSRRPAFKKMIANVILGEIGIIMVKDFSRFSRDHLLMSEFREKVFPKFNIRFISVADSYDNMNMHGTNELTASFKSLFNEYYCLDISHKVKSSLEAKKESGMYSVANVPFGYSKINQNNIRVIINSDEAQIVKKIFSLAYSGLNCHEIADTLNHQQCFAGRKTTDWEPAYIRSVLNNPFYAGLHVWHKYETVSYDTGKSNRLSKSDWKITCGNHDAIIDLELFNYINSRLRHAKSSPKGKRHIFHGLTKCKSCHRALCYDRSKKGYLCCNHCTQREIKKIKADTLYEICLNQIYKELFNSNLINKNKLSADLFDKTYCNNTEQKELLLNNFIKKIEIGDNFDIYIYWNFKNISFKSPSSITFSK